MCRKLSVEQALIRGACHAYTLLSLRIPRTLPRTLPRVYERSPAPRISNNAEF